MENHSELKNKDSSKKCPFDELSRDELITKCKGFLAIAQKAKQAKSDLQNEIDKYKNQLQICEAEKRIKEDNIQTLQELVDSLTEQKLTFITEIDIAQNKVRALTNKCNFYEDEINKYKADLCLKDQNIVNASQKLSDLDNEVISLKRQNNRLIDENEQLLKQLTELETRTEEFNNIGLQQREQLEILEKQVQQDETSRAHIEELNNKIKELELQVKEISHVENETRLKESEDKVEELTKLVASEKLLKEKANIKLRSYKDKILKCANCINQLKNSRFILTKTVKEYSENIPKWQNEIIQASKVLGEQTQQLKIENASLKAELQNREKTINEMNLEENKKNEILKDEIKNVKKDNGLLVSQISELKQQCDYLNDALIRETADFKSKELVAYNKVNEQFQENKLLRDELTQSTTHLTSITAKVKELEETIENLKTTNLKLIETVQSCKEKEMKDDMILQLKALESEKSILVKEKLTAKDAVLDLENRNKVLNHQFDETKLELQALKIQMETLSLENRKLKEEYKAEKENNVKMLNDKTNVLKEKYDDLKKEYEKIQDLNGLLQEEVETLRLSLEKPKDDAEHLSDLNVSLQADIVKLETKLSAYKHENTSLMMEIKESRNKIKEFDNLASEYEDAKSKLVNYKTENAELLNEMKEINQVLKERGEAISKLQKAVSEMERLIETLEKDRDIIKGERDELLNKAEILENDLKNAKQSTSHNSEALEKITLERDIALTGLQEKDNVISRLKEDLEKIKQQSCSSIDLPNDDMSTSTISRAEEHMRMKDLDETFEDKYTKLRIFALKLKKKLNETTLQLQTSEQEKSRLKQSYSDSSSHSKQIHVMSQDTIDSAGNEEKSDVFYLETKLKKLTAELEASDNTTAKVENLEAELSVIKKQLAVEIESHKNTKEMLEKALKDVKKKNVLSLEMEDYERSMKDLTTKMEENKKKIIQMESTIDMQEGTITAMKTQIRLLEEQIKHEETQNRVLKEELQQAVEDGKDKNNTINTKKEIIIKLMQDLEDEKRKNEEADLEMTSVLSEKENIIANFAEEKAFLNSRLKKMEFKCAELNENLRIANMELADLKTEYTSYKVRAQSVLRQNQTVDHSQEEQLKEELAALKAQVDTLTQKLASAQGQCSELNAEIDAARKKLAEAIAEASRAHQRTARLQADLTRVSQQLDSERSQHKLQISTLTQCYKSQITELESKLQKETESLKNQIVLLRETANIRKTSEESNQDKYMIPIIPREEGSDNEMDINVSLIPREEGEGSESAPSPPLSKSLIASGGRRSPVPLERLLEDGVPENDSLDTLSLGLTPEQEIADLRRKVQAQQQRVKHVTVLLAESEREGARLSQLSELLKAELRRVRASVHHAHNTEYMKNVTLKFLTLPPGDERSRLVPVLQKILTLSTDETHKIQAIAKGQDPNPSKGWGSYLPWPGGK